MSVGGPPKRNLSEAPTIMSEEPWDPDDAANDADTVLSTPEMIEDLQPPAPAPRGTPRSTGRNIPKGLQSTDKVPLFRSELKLTRRSFGGYEVLDPLSGQTFALNEFEVSLARMFNGKRPVSEVLDAGTRLGIPVNLESLQKFITQLEQFGLLAPASIEAESEDQPWPTRGQWEASVRALFQSGIRFLRMGKHEEAAGYFEALLQEDPDNVEAKELLEMCRQQARSSQPMMAQQTLLGAAPISAYQHPITQPPPMMQHPVTQPPPMMQQPMMHHPVTQPPPMMQQPMMMQQPPMMMPAPAHMMAPPQLARPPGRQISRPVLIGAAAFACVCIGVITYLLVRGPKHADAPPPPVATTEPQKTATPTPVQPQQVQPTKTEPAKTEPAKTEPAKTEPAKTEPAKTEPANTEPVKTEPANIEPAKTEPAKTEPAKTEPANTEPTKTEPTKTEPAKTTPKPKQPPALPKAHVEAPASGDVTSFLRAPRKVKKGDKLFEIVHVTGDPDKIKIASDKVAEMEKLAKEDPSTYEAFLSDARAELASVRKVSTTVVVAPRAGLATPHVKQGATIKPGQLMAEIE